MLCLSPLFWISGNVTATPRPISSPGGRCLRAPRKRIPFPTDLPAPVKQTLIASGIHSLYSHQFEAWTHSQAGENIILATGTASGKTLAYNLPVFATLLQDINARALYLFPTKALSTGSTLHVGTLSENLKLRHFEHGNGDLRWRHTSICKTVCHSQERPHRVDQSRYASHRHPAASHQLERFLHQPEICRHR